jgi:hypothetical protein
LVSSLHHIESLGLPFVFTNAHAYPDWTNYYNDLSRLDEIDWTLLQNRDFRRDTEDLRKVERYQAEALVHNYLPVNGLVGIICYTEELKRQIDSQIAELNLDLTVHVRKGWYFQ